MTESKYMVNGVSKTEEEMDALFEKAEREGSEKAKELETYLAVCAADPTAISRITRIGRRDVGALYTGRAPMKNEELDALCFKIVCLIANGKTKLKNGTGKGEWNNGFMGSRWWDWESEDGKISCRVAFYSKKFSANWRGGEKNYALCLDFERND